MKKHHTKYLFITKQYSFVTFFLILHNICNTIEAQHKSVLLDFDKATNYLYAIKAFPPYIYTNIKKIKTRQKWKRN